MSQSLNFSISGLSTALNDYNGNKIGSLRAADNLEIRFPNVTEPRRGFQSLTSSGIDNVHFVKLSNFWVLGVNTTVAVTSDNRLMYYDGVTPWVLLPGTVSTNIVQPDSTDAKCRFSSIGQNLYCTTIDGVRSMASGSGSNLIRAGVPRALDLYAITNGDSNGFFTNNVALTTTGTVQNGSDVIINLASSTGLAVGQYVSGTGIPDGTTVSSITDQATVSVQTGNTTVGSTSLTNISSNTNLLIGQLISGTGIQSGVTITNITGSGPYTVTMSQSAYETATGNSFTFANPVQVTLSQNSTTSATGETISFYSGSQVGYQLVFGRVETDIYGSTITRLGAPGQVAIATNTSSQSTNVAVTGTLPKNASQEIDFYRLYRSDQTASSAVTPLTQYLLVKEVQLTASDFTNRQIYITDNISDSLRGVPLYTGSDQEGSLQANDRPPACWDMCKFRDFTLYANYTQPSTLAVTLTAVAGASGVQLGDTIQISGSFNGNSFNQSYTASTVEIASQREFQLVTGGTPSQNIADTTNSIIRVINWDQAVPVHAILVSSSTDLPGQMEFEADYPSQDTFLVTSTGTQTAYDPTLSNLSSNLNISRNGIAVSKEQQNEAVPLTNSYPVGDSSAEILRVIPQRTYVVVWKSDGLWKLEGLTPDGLVVTPWDLTVRLAATDTAVSLNSMTWALTNQGVVSVSDGGVSARSVPIDDQFYTLIQNYATATRQTALGIGYESDRKYVLGVQTLGGSFVTTEYNFNYITEAWTTWSRNIYSSYINNYDNKLYIGRADTNDFSVSYERKTGSYQDYVDEAFDVTIVSVSGAEVTLSDASAVEAGDILYQDSVNFSLIIAVDLSTNVVTTQTSISFTAGAAQVLTSFTCTLTWQQVFGDNPGFIRQFSEGIVAFKTTDFYTASIDFITDNATGNGPVPLLGAGTGQWGVDPWGTVPWGGTTFPQKIRFYVPQDKQFGSFIIPTLTVKQGYSNFKVEGITMSYYDISQEAGS